MTKKQQNLVKSSVKISELFVLIVQYPLVKDPNLHNFSNLPRMKDYVIGNDTCIPQDSNSFLRFQNVKLALSRDITG